MNNEKDNLLKGIEIKLFEDKCLIGCSLCLHMFSSQNTRSNTQFKREKMVRNCNEIINKVFFDKSSYIYDLKVAQSFQLL